MTRGVGKRPLAPAKTEYMTMLRSSGQIARGKTTLLPILGMPDKVPEGRYILDGKLRRAGLRETKTTVAAGEVETVGRATSVASLQSPPLRSDASGERLEGSVSCGRPVVVQDTEEGTAHRRVPGNLGKSSSR